MKVVSGNYGEWRGLRPLPRGYREIPHIGHAQHLCDMAERGEVTLEQMKELVRNPKFICQRCGRVAANSDNLCEPVPLN